MITHQKVSTVPDGPDPNLVHPSDWNAGHAGTIDDTMHGARGSALHSDAHNQAHSISGADHTGSLTHGALASVTADQHHAQAHHAAHEPGGGDAMVTDAAAVTGSLRTLGTTSTTAASGDHTAPAATATVAGHVPTPPNDTTKFLRGDATWAAPSASSGPLLKAQLDPGTATVETETFVVHRDHLKLSAANRLTHQGTSRFYVRDIGENAYGVQGELAPAGNIILGVPKTPMLSFTIPTEYQHQMLNRLNLTASMRASLVGTADLYIENDSPKGGRIAIAGRG